MAKKDKTGIGGGGSLKLGNTVRKCRFEHGEMTQQELANEVGVTRLTIHSIETGKFMPSTLLALKLAEFFGKTVEDIFFIEKNEGSEGK
jgi:putative transcriptional regulator